MRIHCRSGSVIYPDYRRRIYRPSSVFLLLFLRMMRVRKLDIHIIPEHVLQRILRREHDSALQTLGSNIARLLAITSSAKNICKTFLNISRITPFVLSAYTN